MSEARPHRCPSPQPFLPHSRREFLKAAGCGFEVARPGRSAGSRGSRGDLPAVAHSPPGQVICRRRPSGIFLFMTGGPSQMDLLDPKPLLNRLDSQPLPPSFGKIHSQFLESDPLCLGSRRKWGKYGQCGMDMSDLVPHLHPHADEIAQVRSCYADSVIHAPAMYQMNTGRVIMGFPSLGSWVTYGLGSEMRRLARVCPRHDSAPRHARGLFCWGAGFLPAHYQGTLFRSGPVPIVHLKPPEGVSIREQRGMLDLLRSMNEQDLDPADTELSARRSRHTSWHSGCRAAPETVDLSGEPERDPLRAR